MLRCRRQARHDNWKLFCVILCGKTQKRIRQSGNETTNNTTNTQMKFVQFRTGISAVLLLRLDNGGIFDATLITAEKEKQSWMRDSVRCIETAYEWSDIVLKRATWAPILHVKLPHGKEIQVHTSMTFLSSVNVRGSILFCSEKSKKTEWKRKKKRKKVNTKKNTGKYLSSFLILSPPTKTQQAW